MASPTLERPEENPIEKIATSVYPAFSLLAGMQLDLFTPLKDGPLNAEQIALTLNVNSAKLKPLLYALVVAGFLNVEGEFFSNTDIANRFLVKGSQSCVLDIHELLSTMWNAALKTAESIRTGLPQAKLNYSDMSQDELRHFFCGEHPYAVEYGSDLVERYDFSSYSTLLDVGGGSGGLAIAVTEACPNIKATVIDLPKVTPVTQHYINEAGAGNRVKVVAADVVRDSIPGFYDAAVMTAFIQVLSSEDAHRAIKNVSRVMNPGGEIYIRGYGIIDNSRTSPQKLVGFNLVYINVYDEGQAYTEQEHKDWLEEAGFGSFRRTILADGSSIITARKIK
jgi:ubiquinone/menaquinone biosynthesis C-methylase UbiE